MDPRAIAVMEARPQCAGEKDVTERIRKAFAAVQNHWMVTRENEQFEAGLTAAILESPDDERTLIERSIEPLKALNALISGVPVDLERVAERMGEKGDLIPLQKIWREVRGEN